MENKKKYKRPIIQLEEFTPETCLCSCAVVNKQLSEAMQCGYYDYDWNEIRSEHQMVC